MFSDILSWDYWMLIEGWTVFLLFIEVDLRSLKHEHKVNHQE